MSFPKYPRYKDSGVEWLGVVPEHWELTKVKHLSSRISSGKTPLGGSEVYVDQGVTFLRSQNVYDEGLRLDDVVFITATVDEAMAVSRVIPADILLNITGASIGRSCVVPRDFQPANVNQHVCVIRLKNPSHVPSVGWLFKSAAIKNQIDEAQNGAAREGLNFVQIGEMAIPLPPAAEQERIAEFLDREAAKIDALVAEQRRLIELLKEKRQAVISHAVTKGLNPHAPMKPSGIEWLGDVPEHWEVGPVKRFFTSLNGRRVPLSGEERAGRSGEFAYYGASGIIDWIDEFIFEEDLVLVSEDGANLISRSTPISFVARGQYWVNNHAHILKPPDANHIFWAERIESIDLIPFVTGSAQPKLTAEALNNLLIAVPAMASERGNIEKHIITETTKLDALTAEAERGIELLQERRTALISAAVTGKIDVRNFVNQEAAR